MSPERARGPLGTLPVTQDDLDRCIHCGLCLPSCPTYRLWGNEADSPRGRIHLMRAVAEGRIAPQGAFEEHIGLCLGCRACETVCPAGVPYGRLLETARTVTGPSGSRAARLLTRLALRHVLPFPWRLRAAARVVRAFQRPRIRRAVRRLLPEGLRAREALLPEIPAEFFRPPEVLPALGERRARVGVLAGCLMSVAYAPTNEATVRVLRRAGCEVVVPRGQGCCGALHVHSGEAAAGLAAARRTIDAFLGAGVDAIVTNAAGCGATMKEYGHLFAGDPVHAERARQVAGLTRDFSEFLAEVGLREPPRTLAVRATYQDPCHLAHGQRIRDQPRALLRSIPGLRLVEMAGSDHCCGSAGIYNVVHPDAAAALLREKVGSIEAAGVEVVVAPNPGCMLQIAAGLRAAGSPVRVAHVADLLDQAYGR